MSMHRDGCMLMMAVTIIHLLSPMGIVHHNSMKYALYFVTVLFLCAAGTVEHKVIRFAPDDVTANYIMAGDVEIDGERIGVGIEVCNELYWNDEAMHPFHEVIIVESLFFGVIVYDRNVSYIHDTEI